MKKASPIKNTMIYIYIYVFKLPPFQAANKLPTWSILAVVSFIRFQAQPFFPLCNDLTPRRNLVGPQCRNNLQRENTNARKARRQETKGVAERKQSGCGFKYIKVFNYEIEKAVVSST